MYNFMLLVALVVCLSSSIVKGFFDQYQAAAKYLKNDVVNVNTVIFKDTDISKTCWNVEEMVLLATRLEMQDLIPKKVPTNVTLLLEYYKSALQTVNGLNMTDGARKKVILTAFADAFGGHLKHVGIPVTNEAYYAGNIDYVVAKQMHDLFDSMKQFLRTNGDPWRESRSLQDVLVHVRPLNITKPESNVCDEFITSRLPFSTNIDIKPIPPPYLDDNSSPSSLALPLRFRSLFSLMNGNTSAILIRYYRLGVTCLASSYSEEDVSIFNKDMSSWIFSSIVPHLNEVKWYPGFWGVMRIIETIHRIDSREIVLPQEQRYFFNDLTEQTSSNHPTFTEPPLEPFTRVSKTPRNISNTFLSFNSRLTDAPPIGFNLISFYKTQNMCTKIVVIVISVIIVVLLFLFVVSLYVFCVKRPSETQSLPRDSEMELLNTLVALYWELKESSKKGVPPTEGLDDSDEELTKKCVSGFSKYFRKPTKKAQHYQPNSPQKVEKLVRFERMSADTVTGISDGSSRFINPYKAFHSE